LFSEVPPPLKFRPGPATPGPPSCYATGPLSQPHTFSARVLFDETFAQPDVIAVVDCPVVALSVFYLPHCF